MRSSNRKFSSLMPDHVLKDSFYVSSYILLISLLILLHLFFVVFLNWILLHRPPDYNAE